MNATNRRPKGEVRGAPSADAPAATGTPVLALLDDAAAGATLLELSATLARMQRRELSLVYVESASALVAAALPIARVLAPGAAQWRPLSPPEVELGFRAHAARLREIATRIALRDALTWSLRVMRGSLAQAAIELSLQADLLLLAPPAPPGLARAAGIGGRRPRITVVGSESGPDPRVLLIATQLAQALAGTVQIERLAPGATLAEAPGRLESVARSDLLVLSRAPLDAGALARLRCPVLLVG